MAISQLRLDNFKCFEAAVVDLAPLTLLMGKNSSGKSSLLQALFLLSQSLEQGATPTLDLYGSLFPVGSYRSLILDHNPKNLLGLGVDIVPRTTRSLAASFRDVRRRIRVDWWFKYARPDVAHLTNFLLERPGETEINGYRKRGRGGPFELDCRVKSGRKGRPRELQTVALPNALFPRPVLTRRSGPFDTEKWERFGRISNHIFRAEFEIRRIHALGAFRAAPERTYRFAGRISRPFDLPGEYAAQRILESALYKSRDDREFITSLNRWLAYISGFELTEPKLVSDEVKNFSLILREKQQVVDVNYADVGFGISQVLPVLVMGLKSKPGDILLFQQPELHLHPDAQLAIADFLVWLSLNGRQVIAETHSEHVVLRVRYRFLASERAIGISRKLTCADAVVQVVERRDRGPSTTRKVEFDDFGELRGWPRGFMEEAVEQRFGLLAKQSQLKG